METKYVFRRIRRINGLVFLVLFIIWLPSIQVIAQSGKYPQLAPSALKQMNVLRDIKTSRTPGQGKIDSRLFLAVLNQENDSRTAQLPDFRFIQPEKDGRVAVDIVLQNPQGLKAVLMVLKDLDEVYSGPKRQFPVLSARVRLENVTTIANMPEVRLVRQHIPYRTSVMNVSEGDLTHGAQEARGYFGTIGSGVTVGVISDGVDSLASLQASGDLPTVNVLPGQAGSGNEGAAMLEIVHDLAPGATLYFASALPNEPQFAQNILDLAAAGCDIIVDDIIYLDESPFQDGPVAQAVNTVTSAGVLYFSSAGNEGNANDLSSGTWEGDFLASVAVDPAPLTGANLHDFGDGGNSILVEFGGGNPPILIWAEHYDQATGAASTDFDLYDMDGALTTIYDASTNVQDGTGGDDWPIEFIGGGTFGGERLLIDKFADGTTSSVPMFNLIVFRGELDDALATHGATRGHSAAVNAFSVAATPADASFDGVSPDGPFPGLFNSGNETETFSSDGPRRIILGPTGTELTPGDRTSTGGVVRQKPDITAADGVSCAAPGFNPFYGTSAAAPHAAAIASLLKSAVPTLTPVQVRTALVSSAIDIEIAGTDENTGAGIVMAHDALQAAGATPSPFLALGPVGLSEVVGDGDSFVETNEIYDLTIPLENTGGALASAVSGVLSTSTSGLVLLNANSDYPDIAVSATQNNLTTYRILIRGNALCGAGLDLSLTVNYSGGPSSPQLLNLAPINLGEAGTPMTFSYTGPVVAIPDGADLSGSNPGAQIQVNLPVSGLSGNVADVDFRIDGSFCSSSQGSTTVGIDHSFVSDLKINLQSPDGTQVLAIDQVDGSGNNFCQTYLDDESAGPSITSVTSSGAPFSGSFSPSNKLSGFNGVDANGTWSLFAQDFFQYDTGNIRAFSLIITPAICDAPALLADLSATKTVSGDLVEGNIITYVIVITNNGTLDQPDNPGDEFTDVLPPELTLVNATASTGTALATVATNTVTWNGTINPLGESVTIEITASINIGLLGVPIANQGSISFDADGDGSNESHALTDDPNTGTADDPTVFTAVAIPTLTPLGVILLTLGLLVVALKFIKTKH